MNAKSIFRFSGLFASILLLFATMNTSAQTQEVPFSFYMLNASQVHPNVVKAFEQKFKNATPLEWSQAKEGSVVVKYKQNNQTQYAVFTPSGKFLRQFTYGTERDLPVAVKNLFKYKYNTGTVVNVSNVKENGRDIWVIYAEQNKRPLTVKIEDGEIEEL